VLPFLNLSEDAANVYLSDGISEELLGALAHTPNLRVVSRTSSFAFRNKETPLPQIARTLNVTHILEGSVRKSGNRLRISAQLIEVASDSHLWAQTYDRELKDIFEVEDEIARSIVSAMRARLGPEAPGPAAAAGRSTQNVDAYELYLRGRQLWYLRGEDNIRQSILLLERAIELDPQFAGAHAALAQAYSTVNYWYGVPDDHAIEAAGRAAARAIDLDPTLSDAYGAQGEIAEQQMQWQHAETAFRRAIELNNNDSTARIWLGELLFATGRVRDALPAMLQALELEPTSPRLLEYIGVLYLIEGDFDAGCPYIERASELTVTTTAFPWLHLVSCLEHEGKLEEAREAEHTGERVAGFRRPALTLVRRALENPAEKASALEAIREVVSNRLRISYGLPALILLGENDAALDIVEEALRQHNDTALMILWQPQAKGLRGEPRFGKLIERAGLVEYWRHTTWADRCRPTAKAFECD
jgi:TolB-like protein/Tfp pilus assembly protein PilF